MFYDVIFSLCEENGISISALLGKLEIDRSAASRWKNGSEPSNATKKKIADYFGVTVKQLMSGETEQKEKPLVNGDDELTEYLEELKNRPDKRMLFSVTKTATKAQIEAIVKMIEEMQGD